MSQRHYLNALIGGSFLTGMLLMFGARSIAGFVGGGVMTASSVTLARRHEVMWEEVADSSFVVLGEVSDELRYLIPMPSQQEVMKTIATTLRLPNLPFAGDVAEQERIESLQDASWFEDAQRRSKIICGESADGKTFTLKYEISQFVARAEAKQTPYRVIICDIDYGSAHEGSEPNTWFDAPVDIRGDTDPVAFVRMDNITKAIVETSALIEYRVEERAKGNAVDLTPVLLVIDEWVQYYQALERKDAGLAETIISYLATILNRGLKQNVKAIIGLHNLAVNQTGIPQALLQAFNVILLHNASQAFRNYQAMGLESKLAEQVEKVSQNPGCERACLTYIEKKVAVRVIPRLEIQPVVWQRNDPTEEWFQAKLVQVKEQLDELPRDASLTKVAALFGISRKKMVNSNPQYVKAREYWQLKNQADLIAKTVNQQKPELGSDSPPVTGDG